MAMAVGESLARGGSPLDLFVSLQPYAFVGWLINLYIFVELGCLSGVEGPNKFGPPPGAARGPIEPARPSGAVDAASSLFGAQSAIDRAIAERAIPDRARPPQAEPPRSAPAFAAAARTAAPPQAPSFGRRVTR